MGSSESVVVVEELTLRVSEMWRVGGRMRLSRRRAMSDAGPVRVRDFNAFMRRRDALLLLGVGDGGLLRMPRGEVPFGDA